MITKTFYDVSFNEDFLHEISKLYSENQDKDIKIYLSSCGGSLWVYDAVLDIINSNKDKTELIAFGALFSASMDLLLDVKCSKRVLPNTYGMIHKSRHKIAVDESNKPYSEFDAYYNKTQISIYNQFYKNKLQEWGLTDKEIKLYNANKEVYFTFERMLELINQNK